MAIARDTDNLWQMTQNKGKQNKDTTQK